MDYEVKDYLVILKKQDGTPIRECPLRDIIKNEIPFKEIIDNENESNFMLQFIEIPTDKIVYVNLMDELFYSLYEINVNPILEILKTGVSNAGDQEINLFLLDENKI